MLPFIKNIIAKKNHSGKKSLSATQTSSKQPDNPSVTPTDNKHYGKLVVVGNESHFSRGLIDYAVDMAGRMSYEIVALNTAPLSCETFKLFSSSRKQVCEEFIQLAEKNVRAFEKEVAALNIPFTHVIKFCDTDKAINDLQDEIGEIDFIVSDAQADHDFEVSMDQERQSPRCEVFVYAVN